MQVVRHAIDVHVPLSLAYNQWTQFEEFPHFMEGIIAVQQSDDTHLRWTAEVAGRRKTWEAEITEQIPDQRIAWRSLDGNCPSGLVTFEALDSETTRIKVEVEYQPAGFMETLGDMFEVTARQVDEDMQRFKAFVEKRLLPTGAWRGVVHHGVEAQK